jgi:protoporphyrinogen oxidase
LIADSPGTCFVLGAGVTGLSAGIASGFPVLEAADQPGGICTSYHLREGRNERLMERPANDDSYQFEYGGGHWIFGGDEATLRFISSLGPLSRYERRAFVFFPDDGLTVPFPLQNHLAALGADAEARMRRETARDREIRTMQDWLEASFGESLCRKFFFPFHEFYTAGLYRRIAPQDGYKSPRDASGRGYNNQFLYPQGGLAGLVGAMAERCDLRCGNGVVAIDRARKTLVMADGARLTYTKALSTLPLQQTLALAGIAIAQPTDPWTSVLVLNVAALRGPKCPDAHWIYLPGTSSGLHRVGFYSNIDEAFLPHAERGRGRVVSLYIERAFGGGDRPSPQMAEGYVVSAISELRRWGFIGDALIVDPTWIDVAYTWAWPESRWRAAAIEALEAEGIFPVGRYARWNFQGIAESIRDGLAVGAMARTAS